MSERVQSIVDDMGYSRQEAREFIYPILRYFAWAHLPEHLQAVSRPFAELAAQMVETCADYGDLIQLDVGLLDLLRAKDACVRAALAIPADRRPPAPAPAAG